MSRYSPKGNIIQYSQPEIKKKQWLSDGPTWCCICQEFYDHWWMNEYNFGPIMNASLKVGGWHCASHKLP